MRRVDRETGELFTLTDSKELRKDFDEFHAKECKHFRKGIRRSVVRNGAIQFRWQCLECGCFVGSAIARNKAPESCEDANMEIKESYERRRNQEREDIFQKHIKIQKDSGEGFKLRYHAYLKSEEWLNRRDKVLRRANHTCEGCLEASATQIHHISYEHVFDELMFELVALCDGCHAKVHTHEAVSLNEWAELPCHSCQWGSWGEETGAAWCSNFDTSTGVALKDVGLCGPNHIGFESIE